MLICIDSERISPECRSVFSLDRRILPASVYLRQRRDGVLRKGIWGSAYHRMPLLYLIESLRSRMQLMGACRQSLLSTVARVMVSHSRHQVFLPRSSHRYVPNATHHLLTVDAQSWVYETQSLRLYGWNYLGECRFSVQVRMMYGQLGPSAP